MTPAEILVAAGFDTRRYSADQLDMAANGIFGTATAAHYLDHGLDEGRRAPIDCTLRLFAQGIAALPRAREIVRSAAGWLALGHFSVRPSADRLLRHMDGAAGFAPLLLIGDSHAQTYAGNECGPMAGFLPLTWVLEGGSARGLANPVSRSGYGRAIRLFLQEAAPRLQAAGGRLVFKFGQVDVEFVFDLRRVERDQPRWHEAEALAYIDQSIAAYVGYVAGLRPLLPAGLRPVLATIFPPALGDDALRRVYLNSDITHRHSALPFDAVAERMRAFEFPDLATRTRLHAAFNRRLAVAAAAAGLGVLDDFTPLLQDGMLAPAFSAVHGGADHHIDRHVPEAAAALSGVLRGL